MRSPGYLFSVLALAGATACGSAAATPLQPAPQPPAPLASVRMVNRLAEREASMVPSLEGLSVVHARAAVPGLTVNVIEFGPKTRTITAQWPAAGDPPPADGNVVVWVGQPPAAKVVAAQPQPVAPDATAPGPMPAAELARAATPESAAAPESPAPQLGGVTPGLGGMVPPPHGPRTNIRTLAPAAPGTKLSGRASWYGPGFTGHQTACGSTFDPSQLTLASRELRCGTKVLVTGPAGAVEATVTDWGPAEWTNRRFDLSQATFAAVAGLGTGVVDATVTVK